MRTFLLTSAATAVLAVAALLPSPALAKDLRVCADPNDLPFSNRAGQGFENQIAVYVAHALHQKLVYTWDNSRGDDGFEQFLHDTLNAKKCDVIMDVPYASDEVLASNPYYVSSYVFVFPKKKHYDITSMDSPELKDLRIGFEADTPAENGLKLRTLILHAQAFDAADDVTASPTGLLDAVEDGKVAVGVTWEPAVGMYLLKLPNLAVVAVPNSRSQGSPEQYAFPMAMAARSGDNATKAMLDRVIAQHSADLTRILARNGVKLYKPSLDATASL